VVRTSTEGASHGGALSIFIDYDGTITNVDTFDVLVRNTAGDALWHELDGALRRGEISLREALRRQALALTGTQDDALAYLADVAIVDPTFTPFLSRARERGARTTILSAGIGSLMRANLARAGVPEIEILANDVAYDPRGWIMTFRDNTDNGHDSPILLRQKSLRCASQKKAALSRRISPSAALRFNRLRRSIKSNANCLLTERGDLALKKTDGLFEHVVCRRVAKSEVLVLDCGNVGLNADAVDVAAVRCEVTLRGDFDRRAVAHREDRLYDAFSVRLLTDERADAAILNRACRNLRGRRRVAIDEHGERKRLHGRVLRIVLRVVAGA
jgi:HAD superfamily phosphoserine phosphatase-like hydrolase